MEKVMPRNNPASESTTQDNVQKMGTVIPGVENYAGNESGESNTAGRGTTNGQHAPFQAATYINIDASDENRSKKFEYPQVSQDVPPAGRGQYETN